MVEQEQIAGLPEPIDPKKLGKTTASTKQAYLEGFAQSSQRARYWLEKPFEELKKIQADKKKFGAMETIDTLIIARILYAFTKEGGADFDRVMARAYGPVDKSLVQLVINQNFSATQNHLHLDTLNPEERIALKNSLAKLLGKQPETIESPANGS